MKALSDKMDIKQWDALRGSEKFILSGSTLRHEVKKQTQMLQEVP